VVPPRCLPVELDASLTRDPDPVIPELSSLSFCIKAKSPCELDSFLAGLPALLKSRSTAAGLLLWNSGSYSFFCGCGCGCGGIAFAMRKRCVRIWLFVIPPCLSGNAVAALLFAHPRELVQKPLLPYPISIGLTELPNDRAHDGGDVLCRAAEPLCQPCIVVRDLALWRAPHMGQQHQIGAMLGQGQMPGVRQIGVGPQGDCGELGQRYRPAISWALVGQPGGAENSRTWGCLMTRWILGPRFRPPKPISS
jgi:hypothetical protein